MLLIFACVTAFLVNMLRTYLLAKIRFDHGQAAFDAAHDALGLAAFVVSAVIFYFLSDQLASERRVLVKRAGPGDAARSRAAQDDSNAKS
jgi:Na+/H+ antiporter NhaB